MLNYNAKPLKNLTFKNTQIASFISVQDNNVDLKTINSFSNEWASFNNFEEQELAEIGNEYFDIVSNKQINKDSYVLDVGCGSGRWSKYLSNKVKFIEAIDPSEAVFNAHEVTSKCSNVRVTQAGVDNIPFDDNTFDFVFSLGVLHHIPDTQKAVEACVKKLKNGGWFLVYLYYNLDNRSLFFKTLFYPIDLIRRIICKLPFGLKKIFCNLIAALIYWPLARISLMIKKINGKLFKSMPLSYYANKSFYIMRNDALDRFGTPLEQRFSREEIKIMMEKAGLTEIQFSDNTPYWHAIGKK